MGHIPHLLLESPWQGRSVPVDDTHRHHLETVLRLGSGAEVSYTDGRGKVGFGVYAGGEVARGEEHSEVRPSGLQVVAAAPGHRDRARFMVEKLAELGVARLVFLRSRYSQGRPPRDDRLRAWARAGLEQSRGAWLLDTSERTVRIDELDTPYLVCDPSGSPQSDSVPTVVIGPEGGWAPGEVPDDAPRLALGPTILRVETAAIVAASRLIGRLETGDAQS